MKWLEPMLTLFALVIVFADMAGSVRGVRVPDWLMWSAAVVIVYETLRGALQWLRN